jgi:hypothetical protein
MKTIARLALLSATVAAAAGAQGQDPAATSWRTDPAWYRGKAEWALYDAQRVIYGTPRRYEATIFTNKQRMDAETTTKASGASGSRTIEVFKHNLSEMVPTDNYTYRFLTTCFVRTDSLGTYKLVMSSQEDCGATYKQFVVDRSQVVASCLSYFPDEGSKGARFESPPSLAFHDALSLTLRDYPFDADEPPTLTLELIPDQTHTHETPLRPAEAKVTYVGRETVQVPYGDVEAHHLRVDHAAAEGTTQSDYWFAADPAARHVMVRYAGPHGVEYRLKRLEWWAYWAEPRPQ